jgi:mono/diheme cytochrome c family protein
MPMFSEITDRELAEVLTYISNSWGNKARKFTETEVKKVRSGLSVNK